VLLLLASLASAVEINPTDGEAKLTSALSHGALLADTDVELRASKVAEYPVEWSAELKHISCDVWLFIDNGRASAVLHSDCPNFLQPALTESLDGSRWAADGRPADGLLGVQVSHRRDRKNPGGIMTMFRPADDGRSRRRAHPVYPTGVWPQPVELTCYVEVDVDPVGRPIRVAADDCPEGFDQEAENTAGFWRWHPVELDGEPMAFSTRVPITFLR